MWVISIRFLDIKPKERPPKQTVRREVEPKKKKKSMEESELAYTTLHLMTTY